MERMYAFIKSLPLPRLLKNLLLIPPGHFYSPIPSLPEIELHKKSILAPLPDHVPGIELNVEVQLALFDQLTKYYSSIPFKDQRTEGLLYYYDNPTFSYSDAIILHSMIRHLKPTQIVEVGSGYSTCAILDTNRLFFNESIRHTVIDPYLDSFHSMTKSSARIHATLMENRVQDIDTEIFRALGPGDVLFIDSTHVSKIVSDVNYIFFNILPTLQSGVYIHFHDIMYPFEYPSAWMYEGKAWNEAYMLKTFLQYNSAFQIVFFNTYLEHVYEERFQREMPLCMKNRGGSIWLQKL